MINEFICPKIIGWIFSDSNHEIIQFYAIISSRYLFTDPIGQLAKWDTPKNFDIISIKNRFKGSPQNAMY
jgi:hypothetical protein